MELARDVLAGNRRALARLISLVENNDSRKSEALRALYPRTGRAFVIGVTGAPGSGKSSLVDRLLFRIRSDGLTAGVIAVDPTSPFTGGAILGDRIRMQDHALDAGVFIRSMGTRGSLGGLSRATREAVQILDAFGMDLVLVETVGVGQSEVDIVRAADSTVVVLTPAAGDSVQTLKAGIMEIADLFVVNKSDLPGAERTVAEVNAMLEMQGEAAWRPPVLRTVASAGEGLAGLWEGLQAHRRFLEESGRLAEVRAKRVREELAGEVEQLVKSRVWEQIRGRIRVDELVAAIASRRRDPYTVAREIVEEIVFPQEKEKGG